MSHPPLDPPPFTPTTIRKCIRATVRIQNFDQLQEVLILTSVTCSVESQLDRTNGTSNGYMEEVEEGESSSDSSSDFSESSSSSEDDDCVSESDDEMQEDNHTTTKNGKGEAQCKSPDQRYRMTAYWLRKEPVREVRIYILYCIYFLLSLFVAERMVSCALPSQRHTPSKYEQYDDLHYQQSTPTPSEQARRIHILHPLCQSTPQSRSLLDSNQRRSSHQISVLERHTWLSKPPLGRLCQGDCCIATPLGLADMRRKDHER